MSGITFGLIGGVVGIAITSIFRISYPNVKLSKGVKYTLSGIAGFVGVVIVIIAYACVVSLS